MAALGAPSPATTGESCLVKQRASSGAWVGRRRGSGQSDDAGRDRRVEGGNEKARECTGLPICEYRGG